MIIVFLCLTAFYFMHFVFVLVLTCPIIILIHYEIYKVCFSLLFVCMIEFSAEVICLKEKALLQTHVVNSAQPVTKTLLLLQLADRSQKKEDCCVMVFLYYEVLWCSLVAADSNTAVELNYKWLSGGYGTENWKTTMADRQVWTTLIIQTSENVCLQNAIWRTVISL